MKIYMVTTTRHGKAKSMSPVQWMNEALCREVGLEMFFPEGGEDSRPAKRICGECRVRHNCLEYALAFPDSITGIWGGTTQADRRKLKRTHAA
jgi:WhiB family transcriptional regulator, redox-sensing transcriptional regulator